MHYVIIGNGIAGITAANKLRGRDSSAQISIISYEHDHFFSRTALMYAFCGQLSERCIEPYERDHYDSMKFERMRDKVVRLDADAKKLSLESGNEINYDRLLIASGSLPLMFGWPGVEFEGVGNFVTWQDLKWLKEKSESAKRAVIVGGGLIGIEVAEILLKAGIKVTFLIREDFFWPVALDKTEGLMIVEQMRHHGCDVRLSTEMKQILGADGKVVGVEITGGEKIDTDIVVISIGVTPQTAFLKDSGIEYGERGGIVVNDYLETNIKDIFAAGDCTEVVWFNGVRRPEQLWYTGRDQGEIAGLNMAGDKHEYRRSTFYNSAKLFDTEYTTAGLVNFRLEGEHNWYMREGKTDRTVRIVYLPDQTVAGFNMLGRRWDHRVLVKWIEEKRKLDWVLEHLNEANYDEEFMPPFEIPKELSGVK